MRKRGIALIIVVGVLSILAVVATAFVMMAELERKAAQQRTHATKAYLLARSGIEDALARIDRGQDPDTAANRYGGEDWDALAGGLLSPLEAAQEVYMPTGAGTPANVGDCPVRHAMRPSFFAKLSPGSPDPALCVVDGRKRGYSGILRGEHAGLGNHYALKVSPEGGFHVNGGDPAVPTAAGAPPSPPASYHDVLKRILGTLCEALDRDPASADLGADNGSPVNEADGWALVSSRPAAGWASFDEIRDLALGGSQAKLNAVKPYLTLKAWVDKRVIAPNVTDGAGGSVNMVNKDYTSWGQIKLDHRVNPADATRRSPDFERIPRTAGGKIVGRAPVYLGWAKTRKPALIALLAGLKGLYVDETMSRVMSQTDSIGSLRAVTVTNSWLAGDDCHKAADAIFGYAGALDTWPQFNTCCNTIDFASTGTTEQATRDVLKANFNPNSDLNKFNPNATRWKHVDKSDLLVTSTEFSLYPLSGTELQSAGRVLDRNDRLLALRTLKARLSAPGVARISTQKEFVCESLGDLDVPGDETNPRLPGFHLAGPTEAFLSQSQGSMPTWGHTLDTQVIGGASYASSWMDGTSQGAGLQTYPEPCYDTTPNLAAPAPDATATTLMIQPADYDGNLQLAAVELPTEMYFAPPVAAASKNMRMLARFDDGLDLDVGKAYPGAADGKDCQADPSLVTRSLLGLSVWASDIRINTMYPDGCYAEKGRSPAYFSRNNANGFNGLMSFWVKRNYALLDYRGSRYVYFTNHWDVPGKKGVTANDAFFFLGWPKDFPSHPLFFKYEIAHSADGEASPDAKREHEYKIGDTFVPPLSVDMTPHVWRLVTAGWNFKAADGSESGQLVLDAGPSEGWTRDSFDDYQLANEPLSAMDITTADSNGRHLLCLGQHGRLPEMGVDNAISSGMDHTVDDFALYDFGGAENDGTAKSYALSRYPEGRYYKDAIYRAPGAPPLAGGEAASWISASIRLPAGNLLQKAAWTWYRPATLSTDYPEVEFLTPACTGTLWPSGSGSGRRDSQSWAVGKILPGDFRVRVVFRRDMAVPLGTPILDSPVFDDLTLIHTAGASIADWEEGGE